MNSVWCEQQYRHGGMQHTLHVTACHTRHTANKHTETTGRVSCYVRARKAARALHDTRQPKTRKEERRGGERRGRGEEKKKRREREESSVRRWRRSSR
nr:MAG TPA: hypothetical protein [Caudoviricetes sp.]